MFAILMPVRGKTDNSRHISRAPGRHLCKAVVVRGSASYNEVTIGRPMEGEIQKKGEDAMMFYPREKGQGLVEYALILVLVAIVVFAALMILGPIIGNAFSTINRSLNSI